MRKLIFSILLASAAVSPALAQEQDHGRWQNESEQSDRAEARAQAREQRQEQRQEQRSEAREQRFNGAGDFSQAHQDQRPEPQPQQLPQLEQRGQQWQGGNFGGGQQSDAQQQRQDRQWQGRGGFDGRLFEDRNNVQAQINDNSQQSDQDRTFERRDRANWNGGDRPNWSGGDLGQGDRRNWRGGDLRQGDRPLPNVMRDRNPLIVSDTPREGTQPPLRTETRRHWGGTNWNPTWRNDRHYDWHRWRDRHRSTFRIGIYYDPFGWRYRPYQIGWRLWPSYYSRNYWITDPWQYRLPYPPPGTMWVRYWDDALLVDMYTGEVIDVIRDFFW